MAKSHTAGVKKEALTIADRLVLHAQHRLDLLRETEETRKLLAEAIRDAAAAGMSQVTIVKATGYTREQVRLIAKGRTR